MRALAEGMAPDVVAEVDRRLAEVARAHDVRVPWAIESGSRAWGFPSPDSDYDCRFLFVRPVADYLDPWPPRDVVETPLDAVFDVNGWDLVKAVRLATAGNATVGEWLRSPIVYDGDPAFRDDLLAVVERIAPRAATARHYQHLAAGQWQRSGAAAGAETRLKGIFYALRPCAVLHWMAAAGPGAAVPPMNLGELFDQAPPPADVRAAVDELTARKAVTRELGTGPVPDPVRRFVETWLAVDAADLAQRVGAEPSPDTASPQAARRAAADGFRSLLERWSPA